MTREAEGRGQGIQPEPIVVRAGRRAWAAVADVPEVVPALLDAGASGASASGSCIVAAGRSSTDQWTQSRPSGSSTKRTRANVPAGTLDQSISGEMLRPLQVLATGMAVWSVKAGEDSWNGSWFGTGVASVEGAAVGPGRRRGPEELIAGDAGPTDSEGAGSDGVEARPTADGPGGWDVEGAEAVVQPADEDCQRSSVSEIRSVSRGDMPRGWTRLRIPANGHLATGPPFRPSADRPYHPMGVRPRAGPWAEAR